MATHSQKTKAGLKLNALLRKLGFEEYTVSDDGTPITRFEQLAKIIWDRALGYTETDIKNNVEIIHKPEKHFIDLIYDRMEGKVPTASSGDKENKAKLTDKVSDQLKSRLNAIAENDE